MQCILVGVAFNNTTKTNVNKTNAQLTRVPSKYKKWDHVF